MTIAKFVVRHGRVESHNDIPVNALDERLLGMARAALTRLRRREPTVSLELLDGTKATVGLGPKQVTRFPVETWEQGREAQEPTLSRISFCLTVSNETEMYILARGDAAADMEQAWGLHGALYGVIAGTFGRAEMQKFANEREMPPPADRMKQFHGVANHIVAAAPAFMCIGRLSGVASAFGDCFAVALLSTPGESAATTAA